MALTESIKILITAEDKATAKLRTAEEQTKAMNGAVRDFKETSGQAKASVELLGSTIGGTFGGAAGQVAMLTERVSAFSEVAKAGGKGAKLFKAGIVAAVAITALKVGQSIGKMIFKARDFAAELEKTTEQAQKSFDKWAGGFDRDVDFELEVAVKTGDTAKIEELKKRLATLSENETRRMNLLQDEVDKFSQQWSNAGKANIDQAKAQIEIAKQRQATIDAQLQSIEDQTGSYKQQLDLLDEQAKIKEKQVESDAEAGRFVNGLRVELELMNKTAREIEIIKLRDVALTGQQHRDAIEMVNAKHDFLDAEKKASEEKAKQDRLGKSAEAIERKKEQAQQRANDLRKKTAEALQLEIIKLSQGEAAARSYQMQLQGLDASTSDQFVGIEDKIKKLSGAVNAAKTKSADLTTKDTRLLTGSGSAAKSKLEESQKKLTTLAGEQLKAASEMLAQLKLIAEKQPVKIGTVGD